MCRDDQFIRKVRFIESNIYKHQISNARIVPGLSHSFKLNFYRDKRRCVIRPRRFSLDDFTGTGSI